MKQVVSEPPETNEKNSKVVEFMTDSENHVKVGDPKVFDTYLIHNRVFG